MKNKTLAYITEHCKWEFKRELLDMFCLHTGEVPQLVISACGGSSYDDALHYFNLVGKKWC